MDSPAGCQQRHKDQHRRQRRATTDRARACRGTESGAEVIFFSTNKHGKLCGFCELKSARDDFIFEEPEPGHSAIRKNLPFHRKLGSHIRDANRQFDQ